VHVQDIVAALVLRIVEITALEDVNQDAPVATEHVREPVIRLVILELRRIISHYYL
jgi:hypothetical protein